MARYRAKSLLYVDRLVTAGEEFVSSLPPGSNWEPIDDEARASVEARFPSGVPKVVKPGGAAPSMMAIPDNWRDLTTPEVLALAHQLGAPARGTNRKQAEKHIEREIAQRGLSSPERSRDAA